MVNTRFRLAATLGSKSSFKKLPKQSIRTADIPQLCKQISIPPEPLALRLSSNLMVGVARYVTKYYFSWYDCAEIPSRRVYKSEVPSPRNCQRLRDHVNSQT